jgi:hypothetical protein
MVHNCKKKKKLQGGATGSRPQPRARKAETTNNVTMEPSPAPKKSVNEIHAQIRALSKAKCEILWDQLIADDSDKEADTKSEATAKGF